MGITSVPSEQWMFMLIKAAFINKEYSKKKKKSSVLIYVKI